MYGVDMYRYLFMELHTRISVVCAYRCWKHRSTENMEREREREMNNE